MSTGIRDSQNAHALSLLMWDQRDVGSGKFRTEATNVASRKCIFFRTKNKDNKEM